MHLRKKVKIALLFLVVCLVLVISVSYAWFSISVNPEVTSIDTNVGANGSLEIALLNDKTYADPVLIRAAIGNSVAEQDALQANQSWGNVIQLADQRYGLEKISLLPSRLNLLTGADGTYTVDRNMLKVADFGIDGRITILSSETVSAIHEENAFTYYVDTQRYGVRAIGTISNLSAQQIALAGARTAVKSHTAAASRTVKHTWRDHGPAIMDILYGHYYEERNSFDAEDLTAIRNLANGVLDALNYVDAAHRQGVIGLAASQISNETEFEQLYDVVSDTKLPLSKTLGTLNQDGLQQFVKWVELAESQKQQVQSVIAASVSLSGGATWAQIEPLLDVLLDAEKAYLEDLSLADKAAFAAMSGDNVVTLSPDSGIMAEIAAFVGNYSAFSMWTEKDSVELRTTDPNTMPWLITVEKILQNCKAATGGWTRSKLNDTYGFAVDLAFRCNLPSDLLLQTAAAMRVEENTEYPVTQGGGSYMRFTSDNMETEQLLRLMDTIRIGFLNSRSELLAVAKLNVTSYEEQEEGVFAPLYLYDFAVNDEGVLTMGERRKDDASILELPQNSPAIVTVVVWLDGDSVDNSMVDTSSHKSMDGILNLQFSSSADLRPSDGTMKPRK